MCESVCVFIIARLTGQPDYRTIIYILQGNTAIRLGHVWLETLQPGVAHGINRPGVRQWRGPPGMAWQIFLTTSSNEFKTIMRRGLVKLTMCSAVGLDERY